MEPPSDGPDARDDAPDATGSYFRGYEPNRNEELQNHMRRRHSRGATQWELETELLQRGIDADTAILLVSNVMAKRASDRYQTPEEVRWAFASFCQELAPRSAGPVAASPFTDLLQTPEQPVVNVSRHDRQAGQLLAGCVVAGVVSLLLALVVLYHVIGVGR